MALAYGSRREKRPQQLTVVRHALPEYGFQTWLKGLKHALAGRVCVSPVVEGLTVEVANLSVVGGINRLQRRFGGAMPEAEIEQLNRKLGAQKPSVAARVRQLYVREGHLRLGFMLDPELLRCAASAALADYCSEAPDMGHKAFRPLYELGELTLGPVRPVLGIVAYRQAGFSSEAEQREFCQDPHGYLNETGAAIASPEGLAFGPMRIATTQPQSARELIRQESYQ